MVPGAVRGSAELSDGVRFLFVGESVACQLRTSAKRGEFLFGLVSLWLTTSISMVSVVSRKFIVRAARPGAAKCMTSNSFSISSEALLRARAAAVEELPCMVTFVVGMSTDST